MQKNNYHKLVLKIIKILLVIFLSIIFLSISINFYILNYSKNYIKTIDKVENTKVWLVLWAWIKYNKEPTDILKDRLKIAFQAYNKWKIKKIIVSGDNAKIYHNEPEVMEKYLIKLWVDKNDIYKDYAWFDTYDSIYRAKEIFGVKKLVIFTQNYHLYRALYIANKLWIKSYWISTNMHEYVLIKKFKSREFFSRIKAFFEVEILKSKPKFLWEKIEIK
jgi:vancomycin permeability regulator SanA